MNDRTGERERLERLSWYGLLAYLAAGVISLLVLWWADPAAATEPESCELSDGSVVCTGWIELPGHHENIYGTHPAGTARPSAQPRNRPMRSAMVTLSGLVAAISALRWRVSRSAPSA